MIDRLMVNRLKDRLDYKKAIILLGPRQVGKTTLMKTLAKAAGQEYIYFNGDEMDTRNLWDQNNVVTLKKSFGNKKLIILDEAQMIPNIGIICKQIIDANLGIQLLITGSSALDIANKMQESLTGRKWQYYLFPMSISELYNHTDYLSIVQNLPNYLVFGTYPEVINNPYNSIEVLSNLANSYLYKDILALTGIKKPQILEKILTALAWQVGAEVSLNEVATLVGVDVKTVDNYIFMLEQAFVVYRLSTFSRNLRNEINTKKKIFFYDNGIRNALITNYNPVNARNDIGALWENFLLIERKKLLEYNGFYGKTYYWRSKDNAEIDYVEDVDGELYVFEFKWNPKQKYRFPNSFIENYSPKVAQIIHKDNYLDFVTVYPYDKKK